MNRLQNPKRETHYSKIKIPRREILFGDSEDLLEPIETSDLNKIGQTQCDL